jgi:hypothetical protein
MVLHQDYGLGVVACHVCVNPPLFFNSGASSLRLVQRQGALLGLESLGQVYLLVSNPCCRCWIWDILYQSSFYRHRRE